MILEATVAAIKAAVEKVGPDFRLSANELISGVIAHAVASKNWTDADAENLSRSLEREINHLRIGLQGHSIVMPLLFGGVWDSSAN